jgi:hypothetical protein
MSVYVGEKSIRMVVKKTMLVVDNFSEATVDTFHVLGRMSADACAQSLVERIDTGISVTNHIYGIPIISTNLEPVFGPARRTYPRCW